MGVTVTADMAKLSLGRADQQGVGRMAASKLGRGREEASAWGAATISCG
jgi:hypothetical protein